MARPLTPIWPTLPAAPGLVARLRRVPEELWQGSVLFVLVPLVLTAAWWVVYPGPGIGALDLVLAYARTSVFAVCIGAAGALLSALLPAPLREHSRATLIASQMGVICAAVVVGGELGIALFAATGLAPVPGETRTLVYGLGFVFGSLAQALTLLLEGLSLRAREGELHAEIARREAVDARLEALQARTNPHFLFNSLNAIAGLVPTEPERAERGIETLSEVLRYALESAHSPTVALASELDAVRHYLELETLRFAERLRTRFEVDSALAATPVPPLAVQTLVENAVRHGVAAVEGGGRILLSARREAGQLRLRIDDEGPGPAAATPRGTGTALRDLRSRLALLYGERASLTVAERPGGGCRVELRLPLTGPEPGP